MKRQKMLYSGQDGGNTLGLEHTAMSIFIVTATIIILGQVAHLVHDLKRLNGRNQRNGI